MGGVGGWKRRGRAVMALRRGLETSTSWREMNCMVGWFSLQIPSTSSQAELSRSLDYQQGDEDARFVQSFNR